MNVNELKKILDYYDDLYYNKDVSEITDKEYDQLKAQYLQLIGKDEYDYVPGTAQFNKFEHTTPILSLDKVQITDIEDLRSNIVRLWPVVIQPKMDGLTIVTYSGGMHVTRGNGEIGEIVSHTVQKVEGLGPSMAFPIRSEVVMLHSTFEEINAERVAAGEKPFENCRNAAAGMLRNLDSSKVKGLKIFAYNTLFDEEDEENASAQTQINTLKAIGWNTVESYEPSSIDDAMDYIMNFDREALDYDIDGLVIKHNGNKVFGMTGHHPKNAIAVKFEAQGEWTQIHSITYQVGKTGKITPVAELEPVKIAGSTISRATFHNGAIMRALGLNCIYSDNNNKTFVKVVKANDVIPKIIEVRHENPDGPSSYVIMVNEPNTCPCCGAETEYIGDLLYCTNAECDAQVLGKCIKLVSNEGLDIKGLSKQTLLKMMEFCDEHDYEYDFTLPLLFSYDEIIQLPGFAEQSATKLANAIKGSLQPNLKNFIVAANIPLIGKSASEDIANEIRTLEKLIEEVHNDYKAILAIDGIGPKMVNNLKEFGSLRFGQLWDAGVRPKDVETVVNKKSTDEIKTFVITGSFDISRKEIEAMIKGAGHKTSGSVSRKTNYLLASPGEEGTTKYAKAKELGTTIINTIEELTALL